MKQRILVVLLLALIVLTGCTESRYIRLDGGIVVGGDNKPIELINNPPSHNPTYQELITFIKADLTDEHYYVDNESILKKGQYYVCSDYAESVHNNAEAKGIRAAFVCIDFTGESIGHAINAFETTDKGLVFIDCTGSTFASHLVQGMIQLPSLKPREPVIYDSIGYLKIGEPYGRISIDVASDTSYAP